MAVTDFRQPTTFRYEESGAVDARLIEEQSRIPLALVDRLLVEIMRDRQTFVSSALMLDYDGQTFKNFVTAPPAQKRIALHALISF